jgi:hypothetical protein
MITTATGRPIPNDPPIINAIASARRHRRIRDRVRTNDCFDDRAGMTAHQLLKQWDAGQPVWSWRMDGNEITSSVWGSKSCAGFSSGLAANCRAH